QRLPRRAAQVQDRQPRVAERDVMILAGVVPCALSVRPTVRQADDHPIDETLRAVLFHCLGRHHDPRDSAHLRLSPQAPPPLASEAGRTQPGPTTKTRSFEWRTTHCFPKTA